jgi:hypothetical protein
MQETIPSFRPSLISCSSGSGFCDAARHQRQPRQKLENEGPEGIKA